MLQISFMGIDYIIALLKEELHTSYDGLRVEIAIEALIETSLEVEEEKHQFTSLQPFVSFKDSGSCQLELIFRSILFQATTQTDICNQRNKPFSRCEWAIHDVNLSQCR